MPRRVTHLNILFCWLSGELQPSHVLSGFTVPAAVRRKINFIKTIYFSFVNQPL